MAKLEVQVRKIYPPGPDSAPFELAVDFSTGDETTVLFGPSGAGKTLTLECIAGFARPDSGRIRLDGEILFDSGRGVTLPPRRRRCGYVFQRDALFPHMTVRQNLQFAAARLDPASRQRRIKEILDHFGLAELAGRRPHEVSGGERQRCSIARTLLGEPRLLLLDEPARGLDIGLRRQLYAILRQVRAEYGLGMILVTHDLDEAFELADRMLVYRAGRIIQDGPPRDVYECPLSTGVAQLLGLLDVLQGRIVELDAERNETRLATGEIDIKTSYIEGRRRGEEVLFCIHPERVVAKPLNGFARDGQLALTVRCAIELPDKVRLEFPGSLAALVPRVVYEREKNTREWVVEFPTGSIWVFPEGAAPHGAEPTR